MLEVFMEEDHESLAQLLRDLGVALDKPDLLRAFELLDLFWARLAVHIRAENICLFPAILNAPANTFVKEKGLPPLDHVREAISRLRGDHNFFMDELSEAVKTLRDLMSANESENASGQIDEIRRRLLAVGKRLNEHNELEEGQVYRWPSFIFTPAELTRLNEAVRFEIENLPPRFVQAR